MADVSPRTNLADFFVMLIPMSVDKAVVRIRQQDIQHFALVFPCALLVMRKGLVLSTTKFLQLENEDGNLFHFFKQSHFVKCLFSRPISSSEFCSTTFKYCIYLATMM